MKKRISYIFPAAVLIIFLCLSVLTGCASRSSSQAEKAVPLEESGAAPQTTIAAYSNESAAGTAQEDATQSQAAGSSLPAIQPKIIKSAALSVEVAKDTFEESMVKATKTAESMGGYVSNTESYSDADGKLTSGRIVIRVPGDKFDAAIDEIKKIGKLQSVNISGQDVTQEYIDLESRLKNYEAQEKVLLDLMNKSTNVKDSIDVQKELSNVQGEMEVIKGRMNYLNNLVGFSTIDITIAEPAVTAPVETGGFLNSVKRGVEGAVKVLNGLAFFFIAVSPILVFAGIVLIIIWLSIRARNRRRAKRKAEAEKVSGK